MVLRMSIVDTSNTVFLQSVCYMEGGSPGGTEVGCPLARADDSARGARGWGPSRAGKDLGGPA
ncbi:hypothetical protein Afil01_69340 [Actinorhabdospora filicis]|uniref:Uncharacterized protein n=1 Tax=Actinorhabdospora filicis TaxID=1785913 RepID=A0A9W6SUN1_9ACTN|nr:hypothetical protein Afil01_69340 [Actinorhabdospora filicis]